MKIHPLAGKPPPHLIDVEKLCDAYYANVPDPSIVEQRVTFGTSGHRGSSLQTAFNEWHILAIAEAICDFRAQKGIDGPLFLGLDTHALSVPAFKTTLEVLAAHQVNVIIARDQEFTPTPVISHAILTHNRKKKTHHADGIVITPSHNPPDEGGIKYDPPNGGGADTSVTAWIEKRANELLEQNLQGVQRISFEEAIRAPSTHRQDMMRSYIDDLKNVIDMDLLRSSQINIGIDPLGGAGVHYWGPIAEHYGLNLTVVDHTIDPTFSFLTLDWDGKIRMDPSSPYAMQKLIGLKNRFAIAAGCDTDHDRHGIVAPSAGLMLPNHFLSAAIYYLFRHRTQWNARSGIGKTIVSSSMIDRVAAHLNRQVFETPVGFKWFVEGLHNGSLSFAGEQSAGAVFARFDGSVWTTDKDGITMALLAAEMTARQGKDPGEQYLDLTKKFGEPFEGSIDATATRQEKDALKRLSADQIKLKNLAGEKISEIMTQAPGNHTSIGGIKVVSKNGWFAIRPSGTEDIYKIYAESFLNKDHLQRILDEAQAVANDVLGKL